MDIPSVVVGIPAHIRQDLCLLCINSALSSYGVDVQEVIVIDNYGGFSHPSPKVTVLRQSENLGVSRSWNLIHRIAAGRLCVISNDDIEFGVDTISRAIVLDAPFVAMCGWSCFLQREEVWSTVGDYDEKFWPGYYEDNDYHYRMRLAGIDVTDLPESGVKHFGSATLKSEKPVHQETIRRCYLSNRDYYIRKWGGVPGEEKFKTPFGGSP